MIRFVGNRVKRMSTGWVASAGAHIYLGATRATAIACLSPLSCCISLRAACAARPSDITIEAEEIIKMRARLIKEIAVETGDEKVVMQTERIISGWTPPKR